MDHKTEQKKLSFAGRDRNLVAVLGIAVFLVMGLVTYLEITPDWKSSVPARP